MKTTRIGLWIGLLAGLFCVQLLWWGLALWGHSRDLQAAQFQILEERRRLAQATWEARSAESGDPGATWAALAPSFPGIVRTPAAAADLIQISGTELERLAGERRRRQAMVLGEGSLFALLAALGLWLFLRTAQREAYLALQHSNFLHAVTHEFRSPLHALRLAAESLRRRPEPARAAEYVEGMLQDVGRLERMMENLFAVGRLDAAAFRAEPRRVDLSAAVEELARRHGAASWLEASIAPGVCAEADPATLEPILRNLLDNARKYGEGRPVRLVVAREGERAVLRVRDQGRGFTAQERRHLFERFWRAGDERIRTAPGVGLGLFLVRELARAQGAAVEARSDGLGCGAEFAVRWPAAESPA